MNIIESFEELDRLKNPTYIKNGNLVLFLGRYGYVNITLLDNAMKIGKNCRQFTLQAAAYDYDQHGYEVLQAILQNADVDFAEFIKQLKEDSFTVPAGYQLILEERKGINTYSPFAKMNKVKLDTSLTPLKLAKAIMAGQVKEVVCAGRYTDDYAYDAAVNFNKGVTKDLNELAKELIDDRGKGWWLNWSDGKLSLNCCQFLYYDVILCGQ